MSNCGIDEVVGSIVFPRKADRLASLCFSRVKGIPKSLSRSSVMLVSVIIPAYNSVYVRDGIVSVLGQTSRNLELIVVDDGSPGDAIEQICAEFPEIRYIRQTNAGPSAARNHGVREARGELIAFLDDDDLWLPDKLEKQVSLYESIASKERVGLIYTGQFLFDCETVFGAKVDTANGMVYPYLLFGQFIGSCSSVLIPRTVFDEVGYFDERLICTQDFEFFLRIARQKMIYSIDEPLIKYRTRPDQISKDPSLNNKEDLEVLAMQKEFVGPGLYLQVLEFNRKLRAARYKEKAYDSLFRKQEPLEYANWLWKSVATGRKFPSLPSLVYLVLGFLPGRLAARLARKEKKRDLPSGSEVIHRQEVAGDEFEWMGVLRGPVLVVPMGGFSLTPKNPIE